MKDGLPVALGYLSVSLAFGMLSVKKGLPAWVPITISLTNLTGTGQLAGMELMAVHASLLEIAFTVLIINLRYICLLYTSILCLKFCRRVQQPKNPLKYL